MFHVELRMGVHVVREFNLSNKRLWLGFLAPLMADRDFSVEGHDFTPRRSRLKVYEGPELRADELGMGRGWQNVERTATDVTERVLEQARRHHGAAPATAVPGADDLMRERLLGRIAAGPIAAEEILAITTELMPQASHRERLEVAQRGAWALLEHGAAQLTPSGR